MFLSFQDIPVVPALGQQKEGKKSFWQRLVGRKQETAVNNKGSEIVRNDRTFGSCLFL
jgi:hypothetical protein